MPVVCDQKEFAKAVQIASCAAASSGRSALPILESVLLEAWVDGRKLTVTGHDLSFGMQASINAEGNGTLSLAVPAKALKELLKGGKGEIRLHTHHDDTTIDPNTLLIENGSARRTLKGLPAEEFPRPPLPDGSVESWAIPAGRLVEAINRTLFSTSKDETRPGLMGVLCHFSDDSVGMLATDTHRLSIYNVTRPESADTDAGGYLIPAHALAELAKILPKKPDGESIWVEAWLDKSGNQQVRFIIGKTTLTIRRQEGSFPNWWKILNSDTTRTLTVDRPDFIGALRQVKTVAKDDAWRVQFTLLGPDMTISAESYELGRAEVKIPCTYRILPAFLHPQLFVVAYNINFLLGALDAMTGETVTFEFEAPLEKVAIREGDWVHLLMPMQPK